ncbi:MAG TPA: hypothetical protein EYP14_01460 [Planctomycetaceae bacterium]|nr:hypothetical protein [Planctomycetaceae bacterium]
MHIIGKVCAWLIVVLAAVAITLTGLMVQVRNSWAKKTADLKAEYETTQRDLADKQKRLRELEKELARVMLDWNEYWTNIQVDVLDPKAGSVRAAVGPDRGVKQGQTLYLFQPAAEGDGTVFLGPFVVETARQGQCGLRPAWRFRPGEPEKWRYGPGWRFRAAIPTATLAAFRDLEVAFALSDELLHAKQRYLAAQEQLKQSAQQHLNFRLAELHGTDAAPGLVQALEEEEEARNELLVQVDFLRRRLIQTVARLEQLRAANQRLTQQLERRTLPTTAGR